MLLIIVGILAGTSVVCLGGAVVALRSGRQSLISQRISGGVAPISSSQNARSMLVALDRIGTAVSSGKISRTLKQELTSAGFHAPAASAVFIGAKMLLLLLGLGLGIGGGVFMRAPASSMAFLAMLGGTVLFFVPNMVVDMRRKRRRDGIRQHLPDAIDLLEISVSAGMGLDTAWNAVGDEVRGVSEDLADEMALTNLEIHLSTPRAVAMRHMAERTGAQELSSMVAMMLQSERFGTSMADALRAFAQTMREGRSLRAQECAEKMAVKLIFPMVVFLFPAAVMVTAGPAFMALAKALGGHS